MSYNFIFDAHSHFLYLYTIYTANIFFNNSIPNRSALAQVSWNHASDKPLSEPVLTKYYWWYGHNELAIESVTFVQIILFKFKKFF